MDEEKIKKNAEDIVEKGKQILDEVEKKEIPISEEKSLIEEKPKKGTAFGDPMVELE